MDTHWRDEMRAIAARVEIHPLEGEAESMWGPCYGARLDGRAVEGAVARPIGLGMHEITGLGRRTSTMPGELEAIMATKVARVQMGLDAREAPREAGAGAPALPQAAGRTRPAGERTEPAPAGQGLERGL